MLGSTSRDDAVSTDTVAKKVSSGGAMSHGSARGAPPSRTIGSLRIAASSGGAASGTLAVTRNGRPSPHAQIPMRAHAPRPRIPSQVTLVRPMSTSVRGKHVVVTGASSGIGAAMVKDLVGAGARVSLVARRKDLLEALAKEAGGECAVIERDLADSPTATECLAQAERALGPIDVLVNNAGMENTGPTAESSVENAVKLLHLNLHTPLLLTRALLPGLLERGGTVVNVASVSGLTPPPTQAWYGASKAGLAAFSEALRGELRQSRVNVVTVYPGPVTTPMADAAYAAFGGRKGLVGALPEGKPEVLAERIRYAIERGRGRIVYPRFYALARIFPWLVRILTDSYYASLPPHAPT